MGGKTKTWSQLYQVPGKHHWTIFCLYKYTVGMGTISFRKKKKKEKDLTLEVLYSINYFKWFMSHLSSTLSICFPSTKSFSSFHNIFTYNAYFSCFLFIFFKSGELLMKRKHFSDLPKKHSRCHSSSGRRESYSLHTWRPYWRINPSSLEDSLKRQSGNKRNNWIPYFVLHSQVHYLFFLPVFFSSLSRLSSTDKKSSLCWI